MKKARKILSLALCAILLVSATVAGTLAYLTSTDTVTNTFSVGSVAITLDEAKVNVHGEKLNNKDEVAKDDDTLAARVKENAYKLMPGHTYIKDPTVEVADGSEDCYIFVKVENEIAAIEADETIAAQMQEYGWAPISEGSNIYIHTSSASPTKVLHEAGDSIIVFDNFKIADSVIGGNEPADYTGTNQYLGEYNGKTIVVTAYAVQADGFAEKSAVEIWNATFGASQN